MSFVDEDWADEHGYYHWKCRKCGMSGWTDTTPDCACPCDVEEEIQADDDLDDLLDYQADAPSEVNQ